MTAQRFPYLARVELHRDDGAKTEDPKYKVLHAKMEAIGLLRFVKRRVDGLRYDLPPATYAGMCEHNLDDMLQHAIAAANSVADHHATVVISGGKILADGLKTLTAMPTGSSAGVFLLNARFTKLDPFVVTC